MHSIKVTDLSYERLENLKYEARQKSKEKKYTKDIIDFALNQIKECEFCHKKFLKWAEKKC